jgi:O-antigen ligase
MNNKQVVLFSLTLLTLTSTLINAGIFGAPSLAAYFFYVLSASLLSFVTAVVLIKSGRSFTVILPWPVVLLMLLVLYSVLHGLFTRREGLNYSTAYLLSNSLLLLSLYFLINRFHLQIIWLINLVAILAGLESLVCLLQYPGWMESGNNFFRVTGTGSNPNVTAMFLAMALPAVWAAAHGQKVIYRKIALSILPLILLSLFLLQCRTALMGASVAALIVLNSRYDLLGKLKRKCNRVRLLFLFTACIAVLMPLAVYFYHLKQASADGRLLVWEICLRMIAEKPLTGYGYGHFEQVYNLFQAKYFNAGLASDAEIRNGSFVHMAYSEFLQNAVEGGLIGLILFAVLPAGLLMKSFLRFAPSMSGGKPLPFLPCSGKSSILPAAGKEDTTATAYAGIAAFAVMSLVNFTIQAVPVMCHFVLYTAIQQSGHVFKAEEPASKRASCSVMNNLDIPAPAKTLTSLLLMVLALYTGISQALLASALTQNRKAKTLDLQGHTREAITILEAQARQLYNSPGYWLNYGSLLYSNKQYAAALEKFNQAADLTSDPELFVLIGHCCYKTGRYREAQKAYLTSKNIAPNRFAARYALMKLYEKTGDGKQMIATAREIVLLPPKVLSPEVRRYKEEAVMMLYPQRKLAASHLTRL